MSRALKFIQRVAKSAGDEHAQAAVRLRANKDYWTVMRFWYLAREQIISQGKKTGDAKWWSVLDGFDDALALPDVLAGGDLEAEKKEREIRMLKEMEERG